jgi:hypothetical protein
METSREAARIAIEDTIAQLKEIVPGIPLDAPITLNAITPYSQTMQTTFGREVAHRNFPQLPRLSDAVPLSSCGLPVYMLFIIGPWYERLTFVPVLLQRRSSLRDWQIRVIAGEQVRLRFVASPYRSFMFFRESNLMDRLGSRRQH